MKTKIRMLIFGLALVLGVITIFVLASEVKAQQEIVEELKVKLTQQSVPLTSVTISKYLPLEIEVVLKSQSTSAVIAPDDPLFVGIVEREISSARAHGNKIERVQIVLNNQRDEEITRADLRVDPALDQAEIVPSNVSDEIVEATIRSQMQIGNLALDDIDIVRTEDGGQLISLQVTASELDELNQILPEMTGSLSSAMQKLRTEQGAQIPGYSLEVIDESGKPLLKYSNISELSDERATWWMAPGVTEDWFSHPPLPTPSAP